MPPCETAGMWRADSVRYLVLANAATAALALLLGWPLATVIWPFWVQSVVIGWYSRRRILSLTYFSTEGFKVNERPVEETPAALKWVANFFTLHYGFFHLGYFFALLKISPVLSPWDRLGLLAAATSFVASHRASFRQNIEADRLGGPNLGVLMFLPYARIIPMHAMILFGASYVASSRTAVLMFLALKTGADVLMHHVEHGVLRQAGAPQAGGRARNPREV